jgi:hypothetical protein
MTARGLIAPLQRVRRMAPSELRFRAQSEGRKFFERVASRVRTPTWHRERLQLNTSTETLAGAQRSLNRRDWRAAHEQLKTHFATRDAAFPLPPGAVADVSRRVKAHFPHALAEATARAEAILRGRYDLLGYRELDFGDPLDWHRDPVSGCRPPNGFWSDVPYLDPACGDHKIIWELNRHQHWLALGRAFHLSGDARYYREFVGQLDGWMRANPPLMGVNWSSMLELGFRSLSWLWALTFFAGNGEHDEIPWTIDLLLGLDRQLVHVERNLSKYFSPNTHLSGEALALYVAGLALPELPASAERAAAGREVLVAEATRQVLADGGHAERSAHYHRYSTDFYLLALDVARRANDPAAAVFEDACRRQSRYLRTIADDRGWLPLLNDDDGGQLFPICGRHPADARPTLATAAVLLADDSLAVAAPPEETYWLCGSGRPLERVGPAGVEWPSAAFEETGYYVSRHRGSVLVFDAGEHGFLNGGHAHADALSIVLTIDGEPVLIDPGTATYTMDADARNLFRDSRMHNTVVLNGRPQSVPRGAFHWASVANARASLFRSEPAHDYFEARHDAYAPFVHVRTIVAPHGWGWIVVDHILGAGEVTAEWFWHFHPNVSSPSVLTTANGCAPAAELSRYAEIYGREAYAPCLRAFVRRAAPFSVATFFPRDRSVSAHVEPAAIVTAPGPGWHGAAFHLDAGGSKATLVTAVECDGVPRAPEAAPPAFWGCNALHTDARAALLLRSDPAHPRLIFVNGTRATADFADELMASAVHTS